MRPFVAAPINVETRELAGAPKFRSTSLVPIFFSSSLPLLFHFFFALIIIITLSLLLFPPLRKILSGNRGKMKLRTRLIFIPLTPRELLFRFLVALQWIPLNEPWVQIGVLISLLIRVAQTSRLEWQWRREYLLIIIIMSVYFEPKRAKPQSG